MSFADRTCLAVELVLTKKYRLDQAQAKQLLKKSAFYQTLLDDPSFIRHRTADYWAEEILDEYSILH